MHLSPKGVPTSWRCPSRQTPDPMVEGLCYVNLANPTLAGVVAPCAVGLPIRLAHGRAPVIIGKQRHGPIGSVALAFEAHLTRFANAVQDSQQDAQRW